MPNKKYLIIIITILFNSSWASAQWKLSKKIEKFNESSRQVLTWQKGKSKQVYKPESLPLGFIESKEVSINKTTYFITTWAYNGQSVVYRIFNPDIKNSPFCEHRSFSDSTQIRMKKKFLQISILKNPTDPISKIKNNPQWENCKKI